MSSIKLSLSAASILALTACGQFSSGVIGNVFNPQDRILAAKSATGLKGVPQTWSCTGQYDDQAGSVLSLVLQDSAAGEKVLSIHKIKFGEGQAISENTVVLSQAVSIIDGEKRAEFSVDAPVTRQDLPQGSSLISLEKETQVVTFAKRALVELNVESVDCKTEAIKVR